MSYRTGAASGVRTLRYPQGGGYYKGRWAQGQPHGYGRKDSGHGLIYEGEWQRGLRHGCGTLRKKLAGRACQQRVYVGAWVQDARCGEGKQYYDDGSVYFGQWQHNVRHGRGIQWYADGRIYLGEWLQDAMHGRGVLYEGECAGGWRSECNFRIFLIDSQWQSLCGWICSRLQVRHGCLLSW